MISRIMNLADRSLMPMRLEQSGIPSEMLVTTEAVTSVTGGEDIIPLQWGYKETNDLIETRTQVERDDSFSKQHRNLWVDLASKMNEKGYRRSPDECMRRWTDIAINYKGRESPFPEETQGQYTKKRKGFDGSPLESEVGSSQAKKQGKRVSRCGSSGDFSDEHASEEKIIVSSVNRRKKKAKVPEFPNITGHGMGIGGVKEMIMAYLEQQQKMELQWQECMERHGRERIWFEEEWHQWMEKSERERLANEQAWREREDERRSREERRAEKRDALLTTLLNKLISQPR